MNPQQASSTAIVTALMRALHTRSSPAPLLHDPWGDTLVPSAARSAIHERALAALGSEARAAALSLPRDQVVDQALRCNPAFADIILRSRYAEDQLEDAVRRGVRQYVLIGAGFDSFLCRRPAWAQELVLFEVDHPATQGTKLERLRDCQMMLADTVHFVAVDLAKDALGPALQRCGFQATRPSFFSWLGVTMYLSRQANLEALCAIADCAPAGSELVFTYIDSAVLRPEHPGAEGFRRVQRDMASMGEVCLCTFDPAEMPSLLQQAGLRLLEDLDGQQALARYDPRGLNGLNAVPAGHMVHACIAGKGPGRRKRPTAATATGQPVPAALRSSHCSSIR